jgi:hypothetical protein
MTDVYDLIRGAHNRNSRTGITGGLIFLDGHFFQVIEGIPSAVGPLSKRIFRDKRHGGIALRQDEFVEEALFPSEWMALRDGALIDPQVLADHDYEPGMPEHKFGGAEVLAFILACFDKELQEAC